jgi:hypothetical protein
MKITKMNELLKYIFTISVLFVHTSSVFSQSTDSNEEGGFMKSIKMSREQSYITALGGLGNIEPLLFEGAIVPYYMLHFNRTRWGIDLSPKIIIRMYNERSSPIRTPSYMPKATFYYNTSNRKKKSLAPLFLFFSWGHHSNGQSDGFYMPDGISINTKSGDFSTNMIEIGSLIAKTEHVKPYNLLLHKLSFEYHYKQNEELAGKYGNFRINSELNSILYPAKFPGGGNFFKKQLRSVSAQLKMQWIVGDMLNASASDWKRMTTSLRISVHPVVLDEFTFFAQYYNGQDYYNISFEKTLYVLRFGITADLSSKTR